jgi:hypothetical protein
MPAASERCLQPSLNKLNGQRDSEHALAEAQYPRIIVLHCHPGRKHIGDHRTPHARTSVHGHGHSLPRSTDQHTPVHLSMRNELTQSVRNVRVINGYTFVHAHIDNLMASLFQMRTDHGL